MDSVRAERETVAAGTHATVRRLRTELDTARDRRKRSATANRDWQLSVINELYEWETSKARARCDGEVASHRDGLTAQLSDQVRKDQIWNDQTCSTSSRDGVSAESGDDDTVDRAAPALVSSIAPCSRSSPHPSRPACRPG
jgi:hypothetical protein